MVRVEGVDALNAVRQHRGDNLQIEYPRAFDSMPSQQVNPPGS
jgi:hypothetical protein